MHHSDCVLWKKIFDHMYVRLGPKRLKLLKTRNMMIRNCSTQYMKDHEDIESLVPKEVCRPWQNLLQDKTMMLEITLQKQVWLPLEYSPLVDQVFSVYLACLYL